MLQTRHILIGGKVQGVGFRSFVFRQARGRGVTGWVRNLQTGQVEVLAQGTQDVLSIFLNEIKNGPSGSVVSEFVVREVVAQNIFFSFERMEDGSLPNEF